ncbi:MAG TPA: hypothetical protein VNZ86_18750 [Bacteroidia bacterium]|jgi:hypothetical protein|nr:hypothetical protein [Bacteroidia bacterium]
MRTILLFFTSLLLVFLVPASALCSEQKHDTLQTGHPDTTYVKKHHHPVSIKPTTDFDQRFSFIRNNSVNIWGQRGGILLNEELKVGVGAYYMDDAKISSRNTNPTIGGRYVKQSLLFGTAYVEPFLLRRKYWELSVPFEIGFGKANSKVFETSNDLFLRSTSRDFLPTGAGLSLSFKLPALPHFKPLSWIGINFLAGYRYCLLQNVYKTDYDGAFWSISGAIFLDRVFDDCRTWKKNRKLQNYEKN